MISNKTALMALTLTVAMSYADLAHADQAQANDSGSRPTSADTGDGIAEIIVTARRTNETSQSVPLAISVVTDEAIKEANVTEFRDFARLTPSFQALTGNGDSTSVLLTIRGVSGQDRLLTTDSPIGIYVDGVNYARTSNLETAFIDVERVEVLKGPQGTLFGKNNTGGAINITTKQPDLNAVGGYVTGVIGNYDTYEALGVLNLPIIADKFGIRAMATRRERGGFGRDFFDRELNTKKQDAYRLNALFEPNDSVRWAVSGDYTKTTGSGAIARLLQLNPVPGDLPGTPSIAPIYLSVAVETGLLDRALLADRVGNAAEIAAAASAARDLLVQAQNAPFYDTPTNIDRHILGETYGISSNFSVNLTDGLEFRSISAIRWAEIESPNEFDGSQFDLVNSVNYQTGVRNLSQEFQFAGSGGRLDWIVGAYFNSETGFEGTISNSLAVINPTNTPNTTGSDVKNESIAGFGQANLRLTDTVRLTAGARWTKELREIVARNVLGEDERCNIPVSARLGDNCLAKFKNTFSDVSYLASVDWKVTPDVLLYARTARGFKGGGQNLRGTAASLESFSPFRPETVTDYEIGLKSDLFNRKVRLNAAIYHADYKDIQRTALIPTSVGTLASVISNAAKARIRGAEVDLTVRPIRPLTLRFAGALVDSEYLEYVDASGDRSGEPFQFPKYSFTTSADYKAPVSFGTVGLGVNYSWNSKVDLTPTAKYVGTGVQPSYGLLGARLSANFEDMGLEVALYGKNLTDKKYLVSGIAADSSFGLNAGFVGEPRQYGLSVTKRFGGE